MRVAHGDEPLLVTPNTRGVPRRTNETITALEGGPYAAGSLRTREVTDGMKRDAPARAVVASPMIQKESIGRTTASKAVAATTTRPSLRAQRPPATTMPTTDVAAKLRRPKQVRNTEPLSKGPLSTMRAIVHTTAAASGVTASRGDFKPESDVWGRRRR